MGESIVSSDIQDSLHGLFYPRSLAVIGASSTPGKWGYNIFNRLIRSNVKAEVYPIHASADLVLGRRAYRSLAQVPGAIDLAVIVIPPEGVPAAMRECVAKGVKAAIVITAGFKETGVEGGMLEDEVVAIARAGGVRLVGPNCNGHFNTALDLFTTEEAGTVPGPISLVSQSGNFGIYILERAAERGAGFAKFVSSGNEADLTIEDYLEYLAADEDTRVICAYIESVKDGRRFLELARRITREKPIVAMKVGASAEGARAALSHTGSLSGSEEVYDAAFRQSGIIRVQEVDDMVDVALALVGQPLPRGRRVAIVTGGGGFGVVATDACRRRGLEVPPLAEETVQALDKYLPPRWSRGNPVDMAGQVEGSYACIGNLLKLDYIDAVLAIGSIGFPIQRYVSIDREDAGAQAYVKQMIDGELKMVEGLIERVHRHGKPLIVTSTLGGDSSPAIHRLKEAGIYTFRTPEAGAMVTSYLASRAEYLGLVEPQR